MIFLDQHSRLKTLILECLSLLSGGGAVLLPAGAWCTTGVFWRGGTGGHHLHFKGAPGGHRGGTTSFLGGTAEFSMENVVWHYGFLHVVYWKIATAPGLYNINNSKY